MVFLYIAIAIKNYEKTMKKLSKILKIFQLFILLPFEITRGSKKKAYMKIKKTMIAANLL